MTTLHANHAIDAMHRLETMCMMSDIGLPVQPLRAQIISAIDVVVQQNRLRDGTRRIVGVFEAEGLGAQGEYVMRPLFEFRQHGEDPATGRIIGELVRSGMQPTFVAELAARGYRPPVSRPKP
jgi:pilus assembly protein CpaF